MVGLADTNAYCSRTGSIHTTFHCHVCLLAFTFGRYLEGSSFDPFISKRTSFTEVVEPDLGHRSVGDGNVVPEGRLRGRAGRYVVDESYLGDFEQYPYAAQSQHVCRSLVILFEQTR